LTADTRRVRLKAVWLLVLPFLVFSRPGSGLLAAGAVLSGLGLVIRGWAAGTIRKDRELTTTGPYAFTRNPLYLGTLFLGTGITLAGGQWYWPVMFLGFYLTVYAKTMRQEAELLTSMFGEHYRHYAAHVPALIPRWSPYRAPGSPGGGFTFAQYVRNREWEALLGALAGFAFLAVKGYWIG